MSLEDIYGRRVRPARVRVNTPGLLAFGQIAMKIGLIDETGNEVDNVLDVGAYTYIPQDDGTYLVSRLVEADTPALLNDWTAKEQP